MPPAIDEFVTFLYSKDLEQSHSFYHDVLGLEMVLEQETCRIYRITGTSYVGLCSHRRPAPEGVVVTIVSDDVDGWYRALVDAGAPTDGPPRHNDRFGIYHFFANDPDDHLVEFQRFGSDWPGPG